MFPWDDVHVHAISPLPRHFGGMGGLLFMVQSWDGDDPTPLLHAMIILIFQ
jgi:hypothetical protein